MSKNSKKSCEFTDCQLKTKLLIKKHSKFLTGQQSRTLNGLVKAGNIEGALNGLHTILARKFAESNQAKGVM